MKNINSAALTKNRVLAEAYKTSYLSNHNIYTYRLMYTYAHTEGRTNQVEYCCYPKYFGNYFTVI